VPASVDARASSGMTPTAMTAASNVRSRLAGRRRRAVPLHVRVQRDGVPDDGQPRMISSRAPELTFRFAPTGRVGQAAGRIGSLPHGRHVRDQVSTRRRSHDSPLRVTA